MHKTQPKETTNMDIETLHTEILAEIEQSKATRQRVERRITEMKEHYV
jgi:hypothetical protein